MRLPLASAVALAALLLAACGGAGATNGNTQDARPRVLASTAVIADFATRVAGADAAVASLLPAGVDVHSFEPPTQAARDIAEADLILVNGYNLEANLLRVIAANRAAGTPVVVLAAGLEPLAAGQDREDGATTSGGDLPSLATAEGDPHFWLDPTHAAHYVEGIATALAALAPAHAEGYRARGAVAAGELRALAAELREELAVIPAERREIVTFHDAYAYFARAFDFRLAASVLPTSANQEPSAAAIADLVALVRDRRLPAVYREPQFASPVLDIVAEETGARVLTLYSDVIPEQAPGYEAMLRANVRALIEGLAP